MPAQRHALMGEQHRRPDVPTPVMAPSSIPPNGRRSQSPTVVIVETAEHRNRDDLAVSIVGDGLIGNALMDSLVWRRFVEVAHVWSSSFFLGSFDHEGSRKCGHYDIFLCSSIR